MRTNILSWFTIMFVVANIHSFVQAQPPANEIKWQKYYDFGTLHGAKFTADGNSIIAAIGSHIAEIDASNGEVKRIFPDTAFSDEILYFDYSPITNIAVALEFSEHSIGIWDCNTGLLKKIIIDNDVIDSIKSVFRGIAISPDGKNLTFGYGINKNVITYDIENQKIINKFHQNGGINQIKYSPDGKYIAIGSGQPDPQQQYSWYDWLTIWDAKTYQPIKTLQYEYSEISNLSFSDDSKYLISSRNSFIDCLWDLNNFNLLKIFPNNNFNHSVGSGNFINDLIIFSSGGNNDLNIYSLPGDSLIAHYDYLAGFYDFRGNNILLPIIGQLTLFEPGCLEVGQVNLKLFNYNSFFENGTIKIKIELTNPEFVNINLYDLNGNLISEIIKNKLISGVFTYSKELPIPNGVYFLEIKTNNNKYFKKVLK